MHKFKIKEIKLIKLFIYFKTFSEQGIGHNDK